MYNPLPFIVRLRRNGYLPTIGRVRQANLDSGQQQPPSSQTLAEKDVMCRIAMSSIADDRVANRLKTVCRLLQADHQGTAPADYSPPPPSNLS